MKAKLVLFLAKATQLLFLLDQALHRSGLNSTHWQSSFQPESSEDGNLTALHFEVGLEKYISYKSPDLVNQSRYEMYSKRNQREQNKIYTPCTLRTVAIVLSIKLETLSNDNDGGVWREAATFGSSVVRPVSIHPSTVAAADHLISALVRTRAGQAHAARGACLEQYFGLPLARIQIRHFSAIVHCGQTHTSTCAYLREYS